MKTSAILLLGDLLLVVFFELFSKDQHGLREKDLNLYIRLIEKLDVVTGVTNTSVLGKPLRHKADMIRHVYLSKTLDPSEIHGKQHNFFCNISCCTIPITI